MCINFFSLQSKLEILIKGIKGHEWAPYFLIGIKRNMTKLVVKNSNEF